MSEKNKCSTCAYYCVTEEYWHDHYLIPSHHCCRFESIYSPKDIDPEGCCENYRRNEKEKAE